MYSKWLKFLPFLTSNKIEYFETGSVLLDRIMKIEKISGRAEKKLPDEKKDMSKGLPWGTTGGWIVSVFIISAWMFILGVFVGRGTAPVKFDIKTIQNKLAALKKTSIDNQNQDKSDNQYTTINNKTDFDFPERLKEKDGGLQNDYPAQKNAKKDLPERFKIIKQKESLLKKKLKPEPEPEPKIKTKIKPKIETKIKPKIETKKKETAPRGKLTIQVASLKDYTAAKKMVANLKLKNFSAYRVVADIPGKGRYYRVRVGYFQNKKDAKSTLQRLKKEKINSFLISR